MPDEAWGHLYGGHCSVLNMTMKQFKGALCGAIHGSTQALVWFVYSIATPLGITEH